MTTAQTDAITRAKAKQEKQFKKRAERDEAIAKAIQAPVTPRTPPAPGDQKPVDGTHPHVPPVHTSGDQKSVPVVKAKKARKLSATNIKWNALKKSIKKFPPEAKISIIAKGNPKRMDAERRFSFYKEGMTVAQYLTVTKEHGIRNALANDDILWDHAAGFIMVTTK
jgi:hypothetical protein